MAACAAGALLAVPVLWVVLTRATRYTGDLAIIELRIRDVLSAHPPVAGAYSRYGWAHPGPWQFYLFALPYRVLGGDARALQLTTLLFNIVAGGATVWLGARRDRATALVLGTTVLLLVAGLAPMSLAYGWNVTVTVLPFVLTAVGCWRLLDDDRVALPIAVGAAAFVGATHVGVGVVLLPTVVAVVAIAVRRRLVASSESNPFGPMWTITGAIVVGALVPVVYDIVADPPGNLGRLLRWSLTNDEPNVGLPDSLRMIGRSSSLSFLRDPEMPGRFLLELGPVDPGLLPGSSIVLLLGALVIAHRRGWYSELRLCAIVAGLWLTGVVAAAVITEPLGWWLVQWMQPLGWITWGAIALVASRWAHEHLPHGRVALASRWAIAAAVLIAAVAVVDHWRDAVGSPDPTAEFTRPVDELTAAVMATSGDEPIRLDHVAPSLLAETMLSGVVNRLDAFDIDVCIDDSLAYKLGEHRICVEAREQRFLIRSEPRTQTPPAGSELVVDIDPLTPEERIEADELASLIADALIAAGRDEQVPILDSPLADVVLIDAPPEIIALAAAVERLAELRLVPGDRYVLYRSL